MKNLNLKIFALILLGVILSSCSIAQIIRQNKENKFVIDVVSAPASGIVDSSLTINWQVVGEQKTISQTAVYYDYVSHTGNFGQNVSPLLSGYLKFTDADNQGEIKVPGSFSAKVLPSQPGILYYRAMAKIDDKYYWTPEYTIAISAQDSSLPSQPIGTK
jgi:hypothetical protein